MRRVVIAEDEALIRLDLKEMLEGAGYAVVAEASDGETAVRLAEEHRPDLVVLDVKMPVLDGISAAERIVAGRVRHRCSCSRPSASASSCSVRATPGPWPIS